MIGFNLTVFMGVEFNADERLGNLTGVCLAESTRLFTSGGSCEGGADDFWLEGEIDLSSETCCCDLSCGVRVAFTVTDGRGKSKGGNGGAVLERLCDWSGTRDCVSRARSLWDRFFT